MLLNIVKFYICHLLLTLMSFQTRKTGFIWFIFRTQIKIFLIKSESFLALHRQQHNTFKAQKGCKDIVKIVHVTSVVQP